MRIPRQSALARIFSAGLLLSLPGIALAGGGNSPASPKPKSDSKTVKIWTNKDLEALGGPRVEQANEPAPVGTAPAADVVNLESAPAVPAEKDPRWYAQQLTMLNDELASVSDEEGALRHFRETSTGLPAGLNVVLPCNGITTDNRILQLEASRLEILQQLDGLADKARLNGMPPGILVEGRGLVSAETPPTPAQQRKALVERYQSLTGQLAEVQVTIAGMHADATSQNMTLLQPDPRWGGSPTTNLLQDLYRQQGALSDQIDATQDEMRRIGVAAE